jgi:hypothetical protein
MVSVLGLGRVLFVGAVILTFVIMAVGAGDFTSVLQFTLPYPTIHHAIGGGVHLGFEPHPFSSVNKYFWLP